MKLMAMQLQDKQAEWLAERGMNWHVSAML